MYRACDLRVPVLLSCLLSSPAILAESVPDIFADADLLMGEQLLADNACTSCHQRKVGGDGSSIYQPQGRINTPGFLRGMVEQCNTELGLSLFPDEVTSIAAVLNRDHYKFMTDKQ